EAGRNVERGRRTMAEQADPLERVAQLAELFVDEGADPASVAAVQESVDCGPMARGNPVVRLLVLGVPPLGQARAVDELIGHSLKCGDDNDRRGAIYRIQDDSPDVPDPVWGGERRPAELEHSHVMEPSELSRSFPSAGRRRRRSSNAAAVSGRCVVAIGSLPEDEYRVRAAAVKSPGGDQCA